ncbi:hypothetical protein BCV69DRAFT_280190 [Microstroma glucosiphilum]|uniref:TPX2 C-terminal domain-containing protein n=1 Tax=Pseudomicrostroma glucosiphilum TaxID=1684307 RepID=A0A316UG46_9BASI|nr:hypothetical protein BCV69DRAFT_280190 [Pseudomicrostroma glucosiphilum]PWN24297.1 hypothetical protein BCV69DRAFT_280190 [Pseudomicrostroma glucosiphilum]
MASPGLLSPTRIAADDSMSMLMDTSLPLQAGTRTRARVRADKVASSSSSQLSPRKDIDALDDQELEELAWKTMMNGGATWGKQGGSDSNETLQPSSSSITPPRAALPLQVVASPNVEVRRRKTPRKSLHSSSESLSSAALEARHDLKESREERRQRLGLVAAQEEERKQDHDQQEQTLQGGLPLQDSVPLAAPPSSPSKRTLPSMLPFSPYHRKQRPQVESTLPSSSFSSSPFGAERRPAERPSELVKLLGKDKSSTPARRDEETLATPPAKVSWLKKGGRLPPRGSDVDGKARPFRAGKNEKVVVRAEGRGQEDGPEMLKKETEEAEENTPRAVKPKVSSARRERTSSRRLQPAPAPVNSVPAPVQSRDHSLRSEEEAPPTPAIPLPTQDETAHSSSNSETPAPTVSVSLGRSNSPRAATPPMEGSFATDPVSTTPQEAAESLIIEEPTASVPPSKKGRREHTTVVADDKNEKVQSKSKSRSTAAVSRLAPLPVVASNSTASQLAPPPPTVPPPSASSSSSAPLRLTRVSRAPTTLQHASVDVPLGFRKTSTGNLVPLPPSAEPAAYVPASEHFAKLLAQAEEEEKRLRSRSEAVKAHGLPGYLAKRREEIEKESAEMLKREVELMREKELRGLAGSGGAAKKLLPNGLLGARPPPTTKAAPTKVQPFISSLETRQQERRAYESKRAARDALLEQERAKVREEKRRLELEEVKRERERRIPKANPVPDFIYGGGTLKIEAQGRGANGSAAGARAGGSGGGKRKR